MTKKRVLFVCIHNSARSQMAEAWLNHLCGNFFEAHSAGLEPGVLNPLVVEVMREAGIDISHKKTQSVFDLMKKGSSFDKAFNLSFYRSPLSASYAHGKARMKVDQILRLRQVVGDSKQNKLTQTPSSKVRENKNDFKQFDLFQHCPLPD